MRVPVAFHISKRFGLIVGEPFNVKGPAYGPSEVYDQVIPHIKEYFEKLINNSKRMKLENALDEFLKNVSKYAILNSSFKECLSKSLGIKVNLIEDAVMKTSWFMERIEYLKRNFRKIRKEDPLEYAEIVGELVSLLGTDRTLNILRKHRVRLARSTLEALHKVSMMPFEVKKLIKEGKLLLTVAFEIPVNAPKSFAMELAGLSYEEAKKKLKELKSRCINFLM